MLTGKLDHPNTVPIHDLGNTADHQPFYTMKMVSGRPWSELIRDGSLADNLPILLDVCHAVSLAHSRDVIHHDLKPDNVMLGESWEVQLMDWGCGAPVSSDGELIALSALRPPAVNPRSWCRKWSPATIDRSALIATSICLLGGILYQISTGLPPHVGKRVLHTLENARNNVIQPTQSTSALIGIAMKAMQTKPADRYGSVNDFEQALRGDEAHAQSINLRE